MFTLFFLLIVHSGICFFLTAAYFWHHYQIPARMDEFHELSEDEQQTEITIAYERLGFYIRWMNWAKQCIYLFALSTVFLLLLFAGACWLHEGIVDFYDELLELGYSIGSLCGVATSFHISKQLCALLEDECLEYSETLLFEK